MNLDPNDAGTAMGAPMMFWYGLEDETEKRLNTNFIFRPQYTYTDEQLQELTSADGIEMKDAVHEEVVELLTKRILLQFSKDKAKTDPRALGNRSILFDP